jgi:hypothetical protein
MGQAVSKILATILTLHSFYSIESCKKLQVLFIRANKLSDFDLQCITKALKINHTLKVIDFSSNTDLTGTAVTNFFDVLNANRTLEYFGLSKLNLTNEAILPLF